MTATLTRKLEIAPADGWVNLRSGVTTGPDLVREKTYFFTFQERTTVHVVEAYPSQTPSDDNDGHVALPGPYGFYFIVPSATQGEVYVRVVDVGPATLLISPADVGGDGSTA